MAFIEEDEEVADSTNEIESTKTDQTSDALPNGLLTRWKPVKKFTESSTRGGLCFTCHQPTGLGILDNAPTRRFGLYLVTKQDL